ncbi:MAG: NusG domain II-containing protein [Candidatus Eisenbacteria bacterium]
MDSGGSSLNRITVPDLVVIGLLIVLGVYLLGSGETPGGRGHTVVIRSMTGETLTLDINRDQTLEVEGTLGKTTVHIANGAAEFTSSPCPHGLCVSRGRISRAGQWIACLPNGVVAQISGQADYDGITP